MDGGANVMKEARLGEFLGTGSPADLGGRFVDDDPSTTASDLDGGGKAVGAGPHNNGVVLVDHTDILGVRAAQTQQEGGHPLGARPRSG